MPVRELNPIDPRNLSHPCHDEQWLELAKAIGRDMARRQYLNDNRKAPNDDDQDRPLR